jgi:glycerol-3-phosphate dehydrogenase
MIRDPGRLKDSDFDLVIIGGGIQGACLCRLACMRGLRTALIEQNDFGTGTSHNSLKLIHGGMRHLQRIDLKLSWESMRERHFWLQAAPHLVKPLAFLTPTHTFSRHNALIYWLGMRTHEVIGWNRNRNLLPSHRIPPGKIIGPGTLEEMYPDASEFMSNAALWYDAQITDADRLLLTCLEDASRKGAVVCNYLRACDLIVKNKAVCGVIAEEPFTGQEIHIRSKSVINATGPWHAKLLDQFAKPIPGLKYLKSMNLVVPQQTEQAALGLFTRRSRASHSDGGPRLFLVTPWLDRSVIGTTHEIDTIGAEGLSFSAKEVGEFLDDINNASNQLNIGMEDVSYCYGGLLPASQKNKGGEYKLERQGMIIDHSETHNIEGLLSVVGVKYTDARLMAERALNKLQRGRDDLKGLAQAHGTESGLPGATGGNSLETSYQEFRKATGQGDYHNADLFFSAFGTEFQHAMHVGSWSELDGQDSFFRCTVRCGVREGAALRLTDALLRRTNRAARGQLRELDVAWAAEFMAKELAWTDQHKELELKNLQLELSKHHAQIIK